MTVPGTHLAGRITGKPDIEGRPATGSLASCRTLSVTSREYETKDRKKRESGFVSEGQRRLYQGFQGAGIEPS